jgi:hypothetical protein
MKDDLIRLQKYEVPNESFPCLANISRQATQTDETIAITKLENEL